MAQLYPQSDFEYAYSFVFFELAFEYDSATH